MTAVVVAPSQPALAAVVPREYGRSLWSNAFRRLRRHPGARIGFVLLGFLVLLAVAAPFATPFDPNDVVYTDRLAPPLMNGHLLGADDLGRDVLTRVMYGAQTSLRVGIVSVSVALIIGAFIGFTAGFAGSWWDGVSMRVMDVMLSFPTILLAIFIVAVRGPGILNTMLAIAIVRIPQYARISRASVLSLKEQEYVTAARATGATGVRILVKHLIPNSLSPLTVQATLGLATAILEAAALGYLGLGAQAPDVEWGAMLVDSVRYLFQGAWWALTFPGLAIMFTVISFNLIGDGLRDALDPRLRG